MRSHTVSRLKNVLTALFERQKSAKADKNFHGKMTNASKGELAKRLSDRLTDVLEAGRGTGELSEEELSDHSQVGLGDDEEQGCRPRPAARRKRVRPAEEIGEVPHDAVISAAQAESALGRNLATDWDEEGMDIIDDDQRAEEEQLVGRLLHPQVNSVDYSLLAWSPDPDDVNHTPRSFLQRM